MQKKITLGILLLSGLPIACRSGVPLVRQSTHQIDSPPISTPRCPAISQSETVSQSPSFEVVPASVSTVVVAPAILDSPPRDVNLVRAIEALPEQPIDLTTALMMTTGQNPQIAFARARVEEAMAQVDRANALKLPSLRAGLNYNKHEGRIQDVAGSVIETSRGSFYSGLGANAVGAGSPAVPGIVSQFHFADAIFQPKIAQRTACARQARSLAISNDQLLATALAYNELLKAEQDLAVKIELVSYVRQLEKATAEFEKAGEGLASDHDRARTEVALRRTEQSRAEEVAGIASARLAERIRWDSAVRLTPSEPHIAPIHLVSLANTPQEMVAVGLSNRPELVETRHLVGEAIERLKREQNAPLVPSVLLAASYGGLGGGLGGEIANYGDRFDADAVAYWEIRQLGIGEQAIRRESKSRILQAKTREIEVMDRIAREIAEGYVQITARKEQIDLAHEAVLAAQDSFEKNWDRIRNGKGLPIEVLQSINARGVAQHEYVRAVSDYNAAQFSLQRALGWPVTAGSNETPTL